MDKKTREIVGCYVGERGEIGAKALWKSLPPVYRQCAVCYTDIGSAYAQVFPAKRHKAVGKETPINQSYRTIQQYTPSTSFSSR